MLRFDKDVSLSPSCPPIKFITVLGELGKGGQADIFEVFVETEAEHED